MNDATSPYRVELGVVKEICVMLDSSQRGAWRSLPRGAWAAGDAIAVATVDALDRQLQY